MPTGVMTNRGFRFRDRSEAGRVLARELEGSASAGTAGADLLVATAR